LSKGKAGVRRRNPERSAAESKDLTPAPLARFYLCASATLLRINLRVLAVGSKT
jgi:hypothetical protein